jgi:hypothetical protein
MQVWECVTMALPDWPYEAAVDDAIATCDGDQRGALRLLIIVNEYLEAGP